MSQTNLKVAETTEATPRKGFGLLRCPECNEEAVIQLDTDDCEVLRCGECAAEISVQTVRDWIEDRDLEHRRWLKLLAWMESAPLKEE